MVQWGEGGIMTNSLEQRRYDFQLSQMQTHVARVMYAIRAEKVPRGIKWIEQRVKAERKRVLVALRPMFDEVLKKEIMAYIKQVNIL